MPQLNRNNMYDNSFEENFDLKSILEEEGISFKENHKHYFLECPNCGGKDKLNVDKKKKLWLCWSCVKTDQFEENQEGRGNLWSLLLALGFDEMQVKQMFKGKGRLRYTDDFKFTKMDWEPYETEDIKQTKEVVSTVLPKWFLFLDRSEEQIRRFPEVYEYLWRRNVRTRQQYQNFLLYYDHYKKRVVFPAITREKICVGYQSRDITDRHETLHPKCNNPDCDLRFHYYFVGEEYMSATCPNCNSLLEDSFYPKSLNTQDFPKTEFFFNEQNIDWTKPVVLVEGPFDAINVPNSMAFLGKVLSETQFNILLEKQPPKVILYLDGDHAGDYSTKAIYNQLRAFFDIEIVYSKADEDPGGYDTEYNNNKVNTACQPIEWYSLKGFIYL